MSKSPADNLRKLADGLQSTIDDKFRERLENTHKRAREAESQREDGRRLQQLQNKMRALADAWDAGTVPIILQRVKTKNLIDRLILTEHFPSEKGNTNLYKSFAAAWIFDQGTYTRARDALLALGDPNAGQKTEADLIKDKERELVGRKIDGYFPTPKSVVEQMLDLVSLEPGMRVLEPSAGKGNIADAIRERCPDVSLDVVEWNYTLREILKLKGHNVIGDDCMELKPEDGLYDAVIQNPPFENFQDIQHVQAMFKLLKPGGILVSVMSESAFFRKDKTAEDFRDWYDEYGYDIDLPSGAFKDSERSTGVKTRLIVLEKPIEKPLSKIEKPDQDEIQWLARQWSLMVGGSVKDSAVTLASEFEMANEWKLTDLEEQRSRLLKSLEHWEERPESKPGHEHYDWWENEQSNYRKMAWLLGVKISILTKSAEQRAGRDEELEWVAQVNDLARKIDAKAGELVEGGVHPSAALNSEEVMPLMDEYVSVASGGTFQNGKQVVDAVVSRIKVGSIVRRDQAYLGVITSIKDGRCHGRITEAIDPRVKGMKHFASDLNDLVVLEDKVTPLAFEYVNLVNANTLEELEQTIAEDLAALESKGLIESVGNGNHQLTPKGKQVAATMDWVGQSVKHKTLPRWGTVLQVSDERGVLIAIEEREEWYPADDLMLAKPRGFWERKAAGLDSPTPFSDEWAEHVAARDAGWVKYKQEHGLISTCTAIEPVSPPVTHIESTFQWFRLNDEEREDLELAYETYVADIECGDDEPGWQFPITGSQQINFENFVDAFVMEYVEEYGFRLLPAGWKLLGKPDPNTFKPKERVRPQIEWVDATVQLTLF